MSRYIIYDLASISYGYKKRFEIYIRRPRGERGLAPEKDVCTYARDMLHHGVSASVSLEGLAVLMLAVYARQSSG